MVLYISCSRMGVEGEIEGPRWPMSTLQRCSGMESQVQQIQITNTASQMVSTYLLYTFDVINSISQWVEICLEQKDFHWCIRRLDSDFTIYSQHTVVNIVQNKKLSSQVTSINAVALRQPLLLLLAYWWLYVALLGRHSEPSDLCRPTRAVAYGEGIRKMQNLPWGGQWCLATTR